VTISICFFPRFHAGDRGTISLCFFRGFHLGDEGTISMFPSKVSCRRRDDNKYMLLSRVSCRGGSSRLQVSRRMHEGAGGRRRMQEVLDGTDGEFQKVQEFQKGVEERAQEGAGACRWAQEKQEIQYGFNECKRVLEVAERSRRMLEGV
jgi:hypothetical protein